MRGDAIGSISPTVFESDVILRPQFLLLCLRVTWVRVDVTGSISPTVFESDWGER